MATDPLGDVLSRLSNVTRHGSYWTASSPTREDHNPSLSIRQGEKGVLLKDFGGSTLAEIVDALGMEMSDLFNDDPDADRKWLDAQPIKRNTQRKTYKKPVIPDDATFREGSIKWFANRSISEATMKHFHIYTETQYFSRKIKGNAPAICFPYYVNGAVVNVKYRAANVRDENGKEIKDFSTASGAEPVWYNLDAISAEPKRAVIVEGEIDVLALYEASITDVISPPSGCDSIGEEVMTSGAWFLTDDRVRIILAGDMDEPGQKMTNALAARIGKERCSRVLWPAGCKDANDTLIQHGAKIVRKCIAEAIPFPIDGIIHVSEVRDSIMSLYRDGLPRGMSTGIPSLDEHYTVKRGYWTIVTAAPGGGKSNLLDMIMTNLAEREGMRFAVSSLENKNLARHAANILPKYLRLPFGTGKSTRMSEEQAEAGIDWMENYFEFVQPEVPTIESVLKGAKALVFAQGITGLVIDPWNRLMHPPNGLTNGDYISRCLSMISDFAYRHDVHVWLVAHPTKLTKNTNGQYPVPTLYDVSGSAHFYNMTDFGFAMWRDRLDLFKPVEVHVQKSRHQEIASEGVVKLGYDHATTRYYDLAADGSNQCEMWKPMTFLDRQREHEIAFADEVEEDAANMDEIAYDQVFA